MDYKRMTAPCGLDCFNCAVYLAKDNERLRAAVTRSLNVPVGQVACRGCREENGTIGFLGMTGPCNVYRCIQKRGFDFCCDCPDFPCDHLHPYADKAAERPHNTKVFNLCLIKKMGVEKWAETKARSVRGTYFRRQLKL